MSAYSLPEPPWRAESLGQPIPDSPHAVSVSLPLWQHNIGYEEGDLKVIGKMQSGYPRFFINPQVQQLFDSIARSFGDQCVCFGFPSQAVAIRCQQYVQQHVESHLVVDSVTENLWIVVGSPDAADLIKQFWQHGGEIVSSRAAELALAGHSPKVSDCDSKQVIRQRLATFNNCDPSDVYLFPSGMAAIYLAWRVCNHFRPDKKSIQFGFPYVDTLKLQQRFVSNGVQFYPKGDQSELNGVKTILENESIQAVYCESPTNPLLVTPDISVLQQMANTHGCPLVVDDTLSAMLNTETLSRCDLMTTSLTKFFSGGGDVLGGSLIINANGPHADTLRQIVDDEYQDLLYDCDADVLATNSADAVERITTINETAESVADFLTTHPVVDRVFYPKFMSREQFDLIRRPNGGFGGLLSVTLINPDAAPRFYDALAIAKGPNLGTNFSLACPYTILAHYDELEFAETCGVSRNLIRISVGLEEPGWLIGRLKTALEAC